MIVDLRYWNLRRSTGLKTSCFQTPMRLAIGMTNSTVPMCLMKTTKNRFFLIYQNRRRESVRNRLRQDRRRGSTKSHCSHIAILDRHPKGFLHSAGHHTGLCAVLFFDPNAATSLGDFQRFLLICGISRILRRSDPHLEGTPKLVNNLSSETRKICLLLVFGTTLRAR